MATYVRHLLITEWHVCLTISRFERRFSNSSSMKVCNWRRVRGCCANTRSLFSKFGKNCFVIGGASNVRSEKTHTFCCREFESLVRLRWHHSPSFNCSNSNTTTLNTELHDHMSRTNVCLQRMYSKDNIEQTSATFRCLAITRQCCGTYAAPSIYM